MLIDASLDEILLHGRRPPTAVVGRAEQSPLADETVDVAFSSNLLEHVPDLAHTADEIVRVVRPGGHVVLSYTVWLGPWGGHETSPWHYLGGARAARRYQRRTGRPPKNLYGESMYAASCREGSDVAARAPRSRGARPPTAVPPTGCAAPAEAAGGSRDRDLESLDGAPQTLVRSYRNGRVERLHRG